MTIPRSKSAPFPISSSVHRSDAPTNSTCIPRTKSLLSGTPAFPQSGVYSRERHDPFCLTNFYSVANFEGSEDEGWDWLQRVRGDVTEGTEDTGVKESIGISSSILCASNDEGTGAVIKAEDKLGVLSLDEMFTRTGDYEERAYSLYSDGEVIDEESLWDGFRKRRGPESVSSKVEGEMWLFSRDRVVTAEIAEARGIVWEK